jgi:hypothetical protein
VEQNRRRNEVSFILSLAFAVIFKPSRVGDLVEFLARFHNDTFSVIEEWSVYPSHIVRGDLHILKNQITFTTTQDIVDKFYKPHVKRLLQHLQLPYDFEPPTAALPQGKPLLKLNKDIIEKMKTDRRLAESTLLE